MKIYKIVFLFLFLDCTNPNVNNKENFVTFYGLQTNIETIEIKYIDKDNTAQSIIVPHNIKDSFTIPLEKNHLTPILIYTSHSDCEPQGCIYPISNTIDKYGGFSAWILYKLLLCSKENYHEVHRYLSHFNWGKFISYIKKYKNPWYLDQDILLENISDRTFNVYSIKEKNINY